MESKNDSPETRREQEATESKDEDQIVENSSSGDLKSTQKQKTKKEG